MKPSTKPNFFEDPPLLVGVPLLFIQMIIVMSLCPFYVVGLLLWEIIFKDFFTTPIQNELMKKEYAKVVDMWNDDGIESSDELDRQERTHYAREGYL